MCLAYADAWLARHVVTDRSETEPEDALKQESAAVCKFAFTSLYLLRPHQQQQQPLCDHASFPPQACTNS